jgi:hypothetical protein
MSCTILSAGVSSTDPTITAGGSLNGYLRPSSAAWVVISYLLLFSVLFSLPPFMTTLVGTDTKLSACV